MWDKGTPAAEAKDEISPAVASTPWRARTTIFSQRIPFHRQITVESSPNRAISAVMNRSPEATPVLENTSTIRS